MCGLLCRRQSENACKNWLTNQDIDCLFVWVEDVAGSGGMQSNDCKFSEGTCHYSSDSFDYKSVKFFYLFKQLYLTVKSY